MKHQIPIRVRPMLATLTAEPFHKTGWVYEEKCKLRSLLFLCTAAFACTASLILFPGSTIRILCYAQAIYALSLSIERLGLARSWHGSNAKQAVMYFLAGVAFAFSVALVAFARRGDRESLKGLPPIICSWVFRCCSQCTFSKSRG